MTNNSQASSEGVSMDTNGRANSVKKALLGSLGLMLILSLLASYYAGVVIASEYPLVSMIRDAVLNTLLALFLTTIPAIIYKLALKRGMPAYFVVLWLVWIGIYVFIFKDYLAGFIS